MKITLASTQPIPAEDEGVRNISQLTMELMDKDTLELTLDYYNIRVSLEEMFNTIQFIVRERHRAVSWANGMEKVE